MFALTPYIVLFPLLGFFTLGLIGTRIKNERVIGIIGSGVVGISFLLASAIFIYMLGLEETQREHIVTLFTWISTFTGTASSLNVSVAYQADQL